MNLPRLFILTGALILMPGFTSCNDDDEPVPGPTPSPPFQPGIGGDLPCEVAKINEKHCSNCHGSTPRFGGPMPLASTADWTAPAITDPSEPVYHLAKERMNYQSGSGVSYAHATFGPMPPAPNPPLNASELAVMNNWIDSGLPKRAPGEPWGGTGTGDITPPSSSVPDPSEISCTEVKFLAHADRRKSEPFAVGRARDAYYNFSFRAPWTKTVYAKIIKPVIDNDQALHHWLFYKGDNSAGGDGRVAASSGAHIGGELVNGWAPGGEPHYFGPDVGRSLEPGFYNLEVHYNSDDRNAKDMSGISICYVEEKPKNIAELVWLGADNFIGASRNWTGTCEPDRQRVPAHIISVTPHLHVKGRHIKAVINRADGRKEILHDKPFNFDSQVTWNFDTPVVINPGDTITTTCTYSEPTTFGRGTEDEMCYLYATTFPVGVLRSSGLGFIHGPNTCM